MVFATPSIWVMSGILIIAYDPSSKSFVSEPVEVGTNIVATVMSGDQPSKSKLMVQILV